MMTGVFLLLLGPGFVVNSVSLVLVFVPLFILVHLSELKASEEPELVMRLGDEYVEYRRRTPMFIPSALRGNPSASPVGKPTETPLNRKASRDDR